MICRDDWQHEAYRDWRQTGSSVDEVHARLVMAGYNVYRAEVASAINDLVSRALAPLEER